MRRSGKEGRGGYRSQGATRTGRRAIKTKRRGM